MNKLIKRILKESEENDFFKPKNLNKRKEEKKTQNDRLMMDFEDAAIAKNIKKCVEILA
jgi:hypothetical protein